MKNGKVKRVILASMFLFLIIFASTGNTVFAAVNTEYGTNEGVLEEALDKKVKNSGLLEGIAAMIYATGSMIEKVVGDVFESVTGENMFPWADRVIFNTVPFLDVNFFNPSEGSLFKMTDKMAEKKQTEEKSKEKNYDTVLATIVRNMYFTIFVIAVSFLGVVVGIMALKLALSSVASEKAKYKEALVKFVVSLVLLFTMHYGMSFLFFANEQMVIVASQILTDNLGDVPIPLKFDLNDEDLLNNFLEAQDKNLIGEIFGKLETTNFGSKILTPNIENWKFSYEECVAIITADEKSKTVSASLLRNEKFKAAYLRMADGGDSASRSLWEKFTAAIDWDSEGDYISMLNLATAVKLAQDDDSVALAKDFLKTYKKGVKGFTDDPDKWKERTGIDPMLFDILNQGTYDDLQPVEVFAQAVIDGNKIYKGKKAPTSTTSSIISDMGKYFKQAAWTYETDEKGVVTGWSPNEVSVQGAILYTIFVVQSMLFFFAYIKRFFYIVILAMCAPIIVIYDFLGKIMS